MGNPHRGEVPFVVGERSFTLCLSVNSLARLEKAMGMGINRISAKLSNTEDMYLGDWVLVLWVALSKHHPDISQEAAGDLLGEAGLDATVNALGEAMSNAFPDAQKGGGRPSPAAQAGTGQNS